MKVSITEISKQEFIKMELPILFEDKDSDRTFGVVSDGKNSYKIGWQSTIINPVIKPIDEAFCSIGIDLTFVVFNLNTGEVLQKLELDYFFYDTIIIDDSVYVITQLEIIKINISTFPVVNSYALPDYFESFELNDNSIAIKCVDHEVIHIDKKR